MESAMNHLIRYFHDRISLKLANCGLLVLIADFLFYDEPIGWTLGIFGAVLFIIIHLHQRMTGNEKIFVLSSCALLGLIFALVETPSTISITMFTITIIGSAILPQIGQITDAKNLFARILRYCLISAWGRIFRDSIIMMHVNKRRQKRLGQKRIMIVHLLLPTSMSLIFIFLFRQANPIITQWLDHFQSALILEYFSAWRITFWIATFAGSWALIRPKLMIRQKKEATYVQFNHAFTLTALLFNERSIVTSLVLFNGIFLIQNILDIAFLWSGADLPHGMTHAEYAHQGAYPLIITALLAAVFVLIALKPGSATESMHTIRILVYGWVGQNVFLVFSSILRLLNYIEEYSLTYLRVNALIWMTLVALGLVLILARIYFRKNNQWLINANGLSLYATLYLCCFINFGSIIAEYNVRHCREITGKGPALDTYYLEHEIGTASIPALQWFEKNASISFQPLSEQRSGYIFAAEKVPTLREALQEKSSNKVRNWRSWTFRDYRIAQQAGGL
jgi:Domain of unknown function (DUF4173)